MDYITLKYINILSSRLQLFRQKASNLYNFKCPLCGDSKKSKNKTRGYIYERKNLTWFSCHNCSKSYPFSYFIKLVDNSLYDEFNREQYLEDGGYVRKMPQTSDVSERCIQVSDTKKELITDSLKSIKELDKSDPMYQYVLGRKIPEHYFSELFDCPNFKCFVNKAMSDKFTDLKYDERRLLIPFFNEKNEIVAFSGRSIRKDSKLRYINIVLDDNSPKIFGLDRWNKTEDTLVVEGPLDSLFLPNCIATAGGDLISSLRDYDKHIFTIVFDNEPYSKTTKDKIKKAIDHGYKVCIWPDNLPYKDINKMVLEGMPPEKIFKLIKDNSFQGLKANIQLSFWSKK